MSTDSTSLRWCRSKSERDVPSDPSAPRPWQSKSLAAFRPIIDWTDEDLLAAAAAYQGDPGRVSCVNPIRPNLFEGEFDALRFAAMREKSGRRAVRLACIPPSRRLS